MNIAAFALVSFALAGDPRKADQVELVSGTKLAGRVVYQDSAKIVILEGSRFREFDRPDVKSVVSRAANAHEAIQRWIEMKRDDPHAPLDLVRFCQRVGLDDDARMYARAALVWNPTDADAHAILGDQLRSTGWFARDGARWIETEKLGLLRSVWKTGWDLTGTHFRLRTNLDEAQAVLTLLDLECFYDAFFERFAHEWSLYEVVDTMNADVHATRESFPAASDTRVAYFDDVANRLIVDASKGLDRGLVVHEAVHQVLHATAERARGATGDIPAWLNEGLAEYMRSLMTGSPGRARFVDGLIAGPHFARQADAPEPYSLTRVLNFESADFLASSNSDLKYAQSYTLVFFCLHGNGERYRRGFFDFVRGAYQGKRSATHFKEAIGEAADAFEKAWTSYVRAMRRER